MRFKTGDKVLLKDNLIVNSCYDEITYNKEMDKYNNQILTIKRVINQDTIYEIEEDEQMWDWGESMFEKVENIEEAEFDLFVRNNLCLKDLRKYVKEKNITNTSLDEELEKIEKGLNRFKKNNVLIIGKPGIGKTALVEALCKKINRHDVPTNLRTKKIVELSLGGLLAGTRYRGDFEKKIEDILQFATKRNDVIFFIDEIHNLVDCGGAEGAISAGEILKPYLARGEICIIGATTIQEYKKTIFRDKAFNRRFMTIEMKEPSFETTIKILNNSIKKYESHYKVRLNDEEIKSIVKKSKKRNGAFPDKAFDALEEYCYEKVKQKG